MGSSLPEKLNKEPIIDALFELRFNSDLVSSELFPGVLYKELEGNKSIHTLPVSQIPRALREADPNLRFAPLKRLDWNNFYINISDRALSISCKLPYPGWELFKNAIETVMTVLKNNDIIESIERYSIKYVDLIPSADISEQVEFLNLNLVVANHTLKKEIFQVRIEIPEDDFIHVIELVSSASAKLIDGTVKQGVVVVIDSISNIGNISVQDLSKNFSKKLDIIHHMNKRIFFSCLKPDTINFLDAKYAK